MSVNRKALAGLAAVAWLPLLAGCGRPSEKAAPAAVPSAQSAGSAVGHEFETKDGGPGEKVFKTTCAGCHEAGVDRAPHPATLSLMTPESVYRTITSGVMKVQASGLTDTERRQVAEYLTRHKLGAIAVASAAPKCSGPEAAFDYGEPPIWRTWGLTPDNSRLIPTSLAGVDRSNVRRLKLKWAFAFPSALRARSHPAFAGGALYVGSHDGTVYALSRKSGCVRWTFAAAAEVRTAILVSDWKAGDRSARPLAYFGDVLGTLYAVDARTGALVWKDRPDSHPSAMITGAPTVSGGRVYVPVSSLEVIAAADPGYKCCTFRGSIVAYDARSGRRLWQSYSIPQAPVRQGVNGAGTDRYGPSGAPVWGTPAIDLGRGLLYVGTGENYSSPATRTSDAILAMDLKTGKIRWSYQGTANDAWNASCSRDNKASCPKENGPDFDFGAAPILAHASNGRDYVLAGQKSGMVHALDPATGRLIWRVEVGRGGITGGVHFGMGVKGDALFVPVNDQLDGRTYPEAARPGLYALDIRTGKYLWQSPTKDVCHGRPLCHPGLGAAITVTPDLVFAGGNDGVLRAYDTASGAVLWSFDSARSFATVGGGTATGGSFGGAAAALIYHGALAINSGYGFSGKMPGNVLLMFDVE